MNAEPDLNTQRMAAMGAKARQAAAALARQPAAARDVALRAAATALREAAPAIIAANAKDMEAFKGTAAFGVYAASKAATRSFVRTWTTDLKDRHIRSNVVSPGPINTPLVKRQAPDVIARIVSSIPMGRMGEPDEVAKAALYLASDDSSFVTGIELFVDGGRAQV